ncbi:MAG: ADP-forming succinate--CoA ligase subunit beta [Chloroflexota bacterium]
MKLHEYQAKELLAKYGVPVPKGCLVQTPDGAEMHARFLGCPVVIKAQVHAGGRGKSGGILTASSPEEAAATASRLLGTRLSTGQTGLRGLPVHSLLLEPALSVQMERYVAFMVDPSLSRVVCILSKEGGTDIEQVASDNPEAILMLPIDPVPGLLNYQARKAAAFLGGPEGQERPVAALLLNAYRLFIENDCSLLELNPLGFERNGGPVALDAKISIDDSALFRHPDLAAMGDDSQIEPMEREASRIGVSYVKMDGSIGCLVNGAGLAMATMDLVTLMGGSPANFLDVGGAASEDQIAEALHLLLDDPDVRVAWVNVFGGILRCDTVARALLRVRDEHTRSVPFVVRLRGTNAREASELLKDAWQDLVLEPDLSRAARLAVAETCREGEG